MSNRRGVGPAGAPAPQILYEDNLLLAVVKPAGIATMGAAPGEPSLLAQLERMIALRDGKPGKAFLGVVSRLDKPVGGAIVFAKNSKAAARLSEQFRERTVEKVYWALVAGKVPPEPLVWEDWIAPAAGEERSRLADASKPGAVAADLQVRVLDQLPVGAWLEVLLGTGRKHQIRVQCAGRGHPVWGDSVYGSRLSFPVGIGLFARSLVFEHPVAHTPVRLVAPLPDYWPPWVRKREKEAGRERPEGDDPAATPSGG